MTIPWYCKSVMEFDKYFWNKDAISDQDLRPKIISKLPTMNFV